MREAEVMKIFSSPTFLKLTARTLIVTGIVWLAAGCATTPKDTGPKYTFYPPAPDTPRLQFLTSFGSEKDLRGSGNDNFMAFLTGKPPTYTPIVKPYGGAAAKDCYYVCDTGVGMVLKLDLKAGRIFAIAPTGPGALKLPVNVAVDSNGWLYIADALRDQVVILDSNENFVATMGEMGKGEPRDVALTKDRIYVGDRSDHCVHVYDKKTRALLFDIPRGAEAQDFKTKLFQPINLALDREGRLYAADFGAYRVQVYDQDGKYLRTVGGYGDNYGEFARLKGIAVDHDGLLYAVDAAGQVVQMFDDTGRLLMWFGSPDSSRKFSLQLPSKVFLDYDNVGYFQKYAAPDFKIEYLVVVISQYGPDKVSVFGFGHKQ